MGVYPERRRRSMPNIVVILTSVALIGFAIWGGSTYGMLDTAESSSPFLPAVPHIVAGGLGLAAVLVGQRWRQLTFARLLLLLAAVILLGTVALLEYTGPWAWYSLIIPALLLAGSALFLRPVPPPPRQQTRPLY